MYKIKLFLFLSLLISCQASNLSTSSKESEDKAKTTSLSLLDRLRSLPGLRISGFGLVTSHQRTSMYSQKI